MKRVQALKTLVEALKTPKVANGAKVAPKPRDYYDTVPGILMRIFFLAVAIVCLVIAIGMFQSSGRDLLRQYRAGRWEKTPGSVERWNVDHSKSDGKDYYTPYLSYLYAVKGDCFRGSSVHLDEDGVKGFSSFSSEGQALQALSEYRLGSSVTVIYDPNNPCDAVLDASRRGTWAAWFCLLCVPVLLFGALMFFFLAYWPKLSVAVAFIAVGLYWNYCPHYEGNAEWIDGGPQMVKDCQTRIEADRIAWKSLKSGDPEKSIAKFPGGKITHADSARGSRLTRVVFRRQPQMEREAEIVMTQASKAGPKIIKSVHSPYLP
jgi:hypothetical protein